MSASAVHGEALLFSAYPLAADTHWETENRVVWNERLHTSEERELVYEVSWILELGVWRRFLRSQRQVNAERKRDR